MRFDLHVHTTFSLCGKQTIDQITEQAKKKNIDGICITDHDTMATEYLVNDGCQYNGVVIITGMEYSTTQGDFLIFGPFKDIPLGMPAKDMLITVAENGGVAIAAHPFRHKRPVDKSLFQQGLCTMAEGCNGRNMPSENIEARKLLAKGVQLTGGSDAHLPDEIGRVITVFQQKCTCRKNIITNLKSGTYEVKSNFCRAS